MGLREQAEMARDTVAAAGTEATEAHLVALDAAPDIAESGIAADMDVPVHVAWQRMMQDVQWLGKDRKGREYMYRGIDDVMNLVGPAERKHGVFVMPAGIEPTFEVINTKSGAAMNYCRAIVHFTIYGPRGDTMPASTLGEGFDNGDKSASKAQSIALRTLYLNALAIQTNEPARDTEYGEQHELAGPRRPTPEEYAGMILADGVSVGRLTQIKAELIDDRTLGSAEVELIGGEKVRLIDLVQREGKRLMTRGN